MQSISFTSNDGVFEGKIVVKVKNNAEVNKILNRLKKIEGIDKAFRE